MYYVYKTTCLIDDSVYIGVHKSFDIENDPYLGSGLLISRYIKRYGKNCFVRTILYETQQKQKAYLKQKQIVNSQFLKQEKVLNLSEGGDCPPPQWNRHHNKGTIPVRDQKGNVFRVKTSDPRYINGQVVHINKGKSLPKLSQQHKMSISLANKNKIVSNETRNKISKIHKGKVNSEKTKNKISIKVKQVWDIKNSIGENYGNKGKTHSQQTRKLISKNRSGKAINISDQKEQLRRERISKTRKERYGKKL